MGAMIISNTNYVTEHIDNLNFLNINQTIDFYLSDISK